MKPEPDCTREVDRIARAGADWVVRQERGLTATEQDEFSQWLAANPRHRAALAQHRWAWGELDRLTGLQSSMAAQPDPDLLARPTLSRTGKNFLRWAAPLVAAATVVLAIAWQTWPADTRRSTGATGTKSPPTALADRCEQRTLEDGSVIDLNRGAQIVVEFTPAGRHVRLERGEAHFAVVKDPARPFVVDASGVTVRAVGTAFNVRVTHSAVEVLVTEGVVQLARPDAAFGAESETPLLSAGQQAFMPLTSSREPLIVATLTAQEMEARLLWQPRILDFASAPLAEIIAQFNRHNPVQIVLGSPELEHLRLGIAFRSDNLQGFVRLMESDFGMRAEWKSESKIVLVKRP